MHQDIRVRFAPSPTGNLHIGGARTALYNWAFARKHQGKFILRIEDTDPERSTSENTAQILRALTWLGLEWDEGPQVGGHYGPYQQSQRTQLYTQVLEDLKDRKTVYPCFCTPDELTAKREAAQAEKRYAGYDRTCRGLSDDEVAARLAAEEPHTWRIKLPLNRKTIDFDDLVFGALSIPMDQIDDFILVRTDGTPTYNYVVCVDDAHMCISHVIRGDDHISNTPKQLMVYEAMGVEPPQFAHLSMILGPDGKRLSKRHGATSIEAYQAEGYLSDALVNYLALLGWSLDGETTIINRATLASEFSLERVSKNSAVFDPEKLAWMNQVYLKDMGASAFVDAWTPYLIEDGLATETEILERRDWFEGIYPLVVERIHTLTEINSKVGYLLSGNTVLLDEKSVEKCLKPQGSQAILLEAMRFLSNEEVHWVASSLEELLRTLPKALELKPKIIFQALRVAICGNMVSLPLFESMELIGRANCLERLRQATALAG